MKAKLLHICLLHFWALSLVGSPLIQIFMPDDQATLTFSNTGEEESGETDLPNPFQDKFVVTCLLPDFKPYASARAENPASSSMAPKDFVCEVVVPPPQARVPDSGS